MNAPHETVPVEPVSAEGAAKAAHHAGSSAKVDYVCGFLFNPDRSKVVLVEKSKPAWQAGKFNGVGGKIERGETTLEAMRREFEEETGVYVEKWVRFCVIELPFARVFYFKSFGEIGQCRTMETEKIVHLHRSLLEDVPTISDILWLIPLALNHPQGAKVSIEIAE